MPQDRTKWEYRTENHLDEDKLNQLGGQGWELVAVTSYDDYFFKRPV